MAFLEEPLECASAGQPDFLGPTLCYLTASSTCHQLLNIQQTLIKTIHFQTLEWLHFKQAKIRHLPQGASRFSCTVEPDLNYSIGILMSCP